MALSMTRPWKHPKTGVYWLRKRVPKDLVAKVGAKEIRKSLRSKDPSEAKIRLTEELQRLERQWRNLRVGPTSLTEPQAHHLAEPIYDRWFAMWKDRPSEMRGWSTEIGVQGLWEPAPQYYPGHLVPHYTDAPFRQEECFRQADALLEQAGVETDGAGRTRMAKAVAAAMQRASLDLEQLALGRTINTNSIHVGSRSLKTSTVSVDELFNGWVCEREPAPKTEYEWDKTIEKLKTFLGHGDANRISSGDLNKWKASLIQDGLSAKTIRDAKIAPVRTVLQWGVDNGKLSTNPASRINIEVKLKPGQGKRGFKEEEASLILKAARAQTRPALRWVPWLCAYSGARVAEISQLRAEDVFQIDDIWCFQITPDAGPIKTRNSERIVPIHKALIDEGLLKFASTTKAGPLFPELKVNGFGSRGGNGTKIVGRWVRSLGIDDPRISPNHSWRHRFKTLARRHGLAGDIVDALVGHRKKTVADGYGEFPVDALFRELSKLPT